MKPKLYSQKMYLFILYGLLLTIILSIFYVYFYMSYSKNIVQDAKKKSENLCASISNSISTELDNLSTISMNIVYSNAIKENFSTFTKYHDDSLLQDSVSFSFRENALVIYDIITAIIGPFQSASQVNLYTLTGTSVGSGYLQRVKRVNLESIPWFQETIDLNGSKYISDPIVHQSIPSKGENHSEHKFISLTRVFFNNSNQPEGIVEVMQDCHIIFSLITELKQNNASISFYIYNERNELIYPYFPINNQEYNYMNIIANKKLTPSQGQMVDLGDKSMALVTYKVIDPFGWTVVLSEPKKSVYEDFRPFIFILILIIILSMLVTLILCFVISNQLTYPLIKLTNDTKKLTINRILDENKKVLTSADSNIKEIAELCQSFKEMYEELRFSSQKILLLKHEETKSKIQATQSLINPHFLYNNLTNISIMAEENMNDDIIKMCHALCDYLRYISTNDRTTVSLRDEILYTEKYIECVRMRYETDLIYQCEVPKETEHIQIPKLIIQPLVENIFLHGFNGAPPWHLKIKSEIKEDHWLIHVEDNGGLLSDEKKKELLTSFAHLNTDEELKSLKIGGMGLKNVYLRLHLIYGDKTIFKIKNKQSVKTIFTIGGPIDKEEV